MNSQNFWKGKKVFITGHTGFKGSWLSLWLYSLGAEITGYSLTPPTNPSMFELCRISEITNTIIGDVRDYKNLEQVITEINPDIIFHLAAQPLVRESYLNPIITYETNVMGTVNLLESIRNLSKINDKRRAIVNVTTDKCYENKEWIWGYREIDNLGGYDPYSNSKACAELITSCYLQSFFNLDTYDDLGVALASVRAGNVIGGGDFATDRLVPDVVRAFLANNDITLRNPLAIRPWQHVLEPLSGYIKLAEMLYNNGCDYQGAWNFGPLNSDLITVKEVVEKISNKWGNSTKIQILNNKDGHETQILMLDCSKSKVNLGWQPKWDIDKTVDKVVEWTKAYRDRLNLRDISLMQINEYIKSV